MIVAEDLGEEAPDGRDRAKDPVAVTDTVFVEDVVDARLGQDVGDREAVVARSERGAAPGWSWCRLGRLVAG